MQLMKYEDRLENKAFFHGEKGRTSAATYVHSFMDSMGWSIAFTVNNEIIIGGPACVTGGVTIYKEPSPKLVPTLLGAQTAREANISFDFGYSVTSGNFFSDDKNEYYYAIGSTFGGGGFGKIAFLNKKFENVFSLDDKEFLTMYAGSLCAAYLSGDQRSDLLVGSPTWYNMAGDKTSYDEGAVHVYFSTSTMALKHIYTIKGVQAGSRFGTTIVNIGDMDNDNKDEIVIAAPYENEGRGAIYFYKGASFDSHIVPSHYQKIEAQYSRNFGLSMTPLIDYDGEGSNGLAVGSPESNKVAILKHIFPIRITNLYTTFPNLQERKLLDETFDFNVCFQALFPLKPATMTSEFEVKVSLIHPHIKFKESKTEITYTVLLNKDTALNCEKMTVVTPRGTNYEVYLEYIVIVKQVDNSKNYLQKGEPLIYEVKDNIKKIQEKISALPATDCQDPKACKPEFTGDIINMNNVLNYVVGSTKSETISLNLVNRGETAYSSCLHLSTTNVPIIVLPPNCIPLSDSDIKCYPKSKIPYNSKWDLNDITLDTRYLTSMDSIININVEVYNDCENKVATHFSKSINLTHDISGISMTESSNVAPALFYENDKSFQHKYVIENGITTLRNIQVVLQLDNVIFIDKIYKSGKIMRTCNIPNMDRNELKSLNISCYIERLKPNRTLDIIIPIMIPFSAVEQTLKTQNITVESKLTLKVNDAIITKRLGTKLVLKQVCVPLHIIVSSIIAALLILLVIIIILYKVGFLKRKVKRELKREIVRRSMRRHSTKLEEESTDPQLTIE